MGQSVGQGQLAWAETSRYVDLVLSSTDRDYTIDALRKSLGADCAFLCESLLGRDRPAVLGRTGISQRTADEIAAEWNSVFANCSLSRLMDEDIPQLIHTSADRTSKNGMFASDGFRGICSRFKDWDVGHWMIAVLPTSNSSALTSFFVRRVGSPPFEQAERSKLAALYPTLIAALRIRDRLQESEDTCTGLSGLLDQVGVPIYLITVGGEVIFANASAKKLEQKKVFAVKGRKLTALNSEAQLSLLAATKTLSNGSTAYKLVGIDSSYELLLARLRPRTSRGEPLFAIIVTTSSGQLVASPTFIQTIGELYRLTPSEAKVAAAIASGKSPAEVAEEFDVSVATVRSQLSRVFLKTATERQTELGRLFSMLTVFVN